MKHSEVKHISETLTMAVNTLANMNDTDDVFEYDRLYHKSINTLLNLRSWVESHDYSK